MPDILYRLWNIAGPYLAAFAGGAIMAAILITVLIVAYVVLFHPKKEPCARKIAKIGRYTRGEGE